MNATNKSDMKKETKTLSFKTLLICILSLTLFTGLPYQSRAAADTKAKKKKVYNTETLKAELSVDFRPNVEIELFEHDAIIRPAKGNKIAIEVSYIAEGLDEKDAQMLKKAMKANLIEKKGQNIKLSNRFYEYYSQFSLGMLWGKIYMHLKNGEKLSIDKFKFTKIEIFLPRDMDLTINSKYNSLRQKQSVNGNLTITGYDMEYSVPSITGNLKVDGKYSSFYIPEAGDAKLKLYDCKFRSDKLGKIEASNKYSELHVNEMEELTITAYEGEIEANSLTDANINAKYCEIDLGDCKNITAELYEGHLNIEKANHVKINGKYFESRMETLTTLEMTEAYENDFSIKQIDQLSSKNGKYCLFNIGTLTKSVSLINSYEDDLSIDRVKASFRAIETNGKYMVIKLGIASTANYLLEGEIQYYNFEFEQSDFSNIVHKEHGNKLKYKYQRGADNNSKRISISGYEIDVIINHL
ncbi:hypothetical protein L21SP5_01218 [Salinivirga cyanobacteriivorans]|uniref:Adhesin domain-containing protein n=2 Tax=Salinivirga cyanobacteriivorans TaxID=1307839 RepID=A0A0S2HXP6_9BACT|nr:hypothetical protein L21SP5_01218 [Salinivirga cyanobacteriivorans]